MNKKIKLELNNLFNKEKNLENLLLFALKNLAPNFFHKGDLKYIESILPDANSNQLLDVNIYIILEISLSKDRCVK